MSDPQFIFQFGDEQLLVTPYNALIRYFDGMDSMNHVEMEFDGHRQGFRVPEQYIEQMHEQGFSYMVTDKRFIRDEDKEWDIRMSAKELENEIEDI